MGFCANVKPQRQLTAGDFRCTGVGMRLSLG
jgi:hypothetical protein